MNQPWRLLDTGIKSAAENIALDSVLLELRDKGKIPSTLRFLKFGPPAVLVGYHQTIEHEVRLNYCHRQGIDVNRRITGGGAIFFDLSQLGWELIGLRREVGFRLDTVTEKIAQGIVLGLRKLGIEASFRPRNDIEVNGKKISGTGGTFEGDAFFFQGTLLLDFDIESMIRALKIPVEKLASKEIDSARERVTWLKRELGYLPDLEEIKKVLSDGLKESLDIELVEGNLLNNEVELLEEKLPYYNSIEWLEEVKEPIGCRQIVKASYKAKGGFIRAQLIVDTKRRLIKQALISGDYFIHPKRTIFDLEATLKDIQFDTIEKTVEEFFKEKTPQMLNLKGNDFLIPIKEAVEKAEYVNLGFNIDEANALNCVNGNLVENINKASVLLLPYCAKFLECEYRSYDGCNECGRCSVGEAYQLAKQYHLKPITILNYKHLKEVLNNCRQDGVNSFIGCCCEAFFNKRQHVFRSSGMSGVLLDIDSVTCYDLEQENKALLGKFESQTNLKLTLLKKVIESGHR